MIEAISATQRAALETLADVLDPSSYLAGGVAVALRLGHRQSHDLDLFVPVSDPVPLEQELVSRGVRLVSRAEGSLHLEVGGVPVSVLRYRYPLLAPPEALPGVAVNVASMDDLETMKLAAIAGRGAARDFWDLHALLLARRRTLGEALDAYRRKYASEDVGHVVRSLVYFEDADAGPTPRGLTKELWQQIKGDFATWTRALE